MKWADVIQENESARIRRKQTYNNARAASGGALPSALLSYTKSLTMKQAAATLAIVFCLSVMGGVYEILAAWHRARDATLERVTQTADLVETSAVEAAYNISFRVAENLAQDLIETEDIVGVKLRSNFGDVLAEIGQQDQPVSNTDRGDLALWLFGDITRHTLPLIKGSEAKRLEVGHLTIRLSAHRLAEDFYASALENIAVGVLRALGICAFVVLVFFFLTTRPLLRLSGAIAAIDPARPGAFPIPVPSGHRHDEMGHVATALNDLMTAFQAGLDRRDAAEQELTALNRDLEQRVAARTEELEHANQALEYEKTETERAFSELEATHNALREANQQILDSLHYAQRIQAATLPDRRALDGDIADLQLWWQPLHEVGGDYVWMARVDGKCLILLADCTGHGVPGAFMSLIAATAIDRIVHDRGLRRPARILAALDHLVRQRLRQDNAETESDEGMDAMACLWDPAASTLTFAGAGMPMLYWDGAAIQEIRGDRAALGYRTLRRAQQFTEHTISVTPGMTFYGLTDGVTDQMGEKTHRLFGRRRLRRELATLQDRPLTAQIDAIKAILAAYRGSEAVRDDITMLAFIPQGVKDAPQPERQASK